MPESTPSHPLKSLYPELARFPTVAEAEAALSEARSRMARTPQRWLRTLICLATLVVLVVALVAVIQLVRDWAPGLAKARPILVAVVSAVVSGLGFQYAFRGPVRRALREELCSAGLPICIPCGYDLRNLDTPRCPECGAEFDPRLLESKGDVEQTDRASDDHR